MKNILYTLSLFLVSSSFLFAQTITSTGSLNAPRWFHETQLLYNGKVLAFGGDDCRSATGVSVYASAQLYNVTTGSWTNTGSMNKQRTRFASVVLPDGNILAIGGGQTAAVDPITASCEIYNVQTGTWAYTDSLHSSRIMHSAIVLKNGKILVAGGLGSANSELYNPSTKKWTLTGSPSKINTDGANLVLLADGRVLATADHDAEIYNPDTETWTLLSSKLIGERFYHSAVLLNNGNVLITGSTTTTDQATAEIFNTVTQTFISAPSMTQDRACSKAVLMDNGKVLAYGLGDLFNPVNSKVIEVYDPATNSWSSNIYNGLGTQGYSIVKLGNGKFLVSGGDLDFNVASTTCLLIDQNLTNCTTLPLITSSVSGDAICYGKGSTISIASSESGVTYTLQLGNSTLAKVTGTGSTLTIPVASSGIQAGNNVYTVYANKANCTAVSLADTAIIKAGVTTTKPVITSSGNSICAGDSAKLAVPSGYSSYKWSTSAATPVIYVKNSSDYWVEVTSSTGCKSLPSDAIHISVNPVLPVSISISTARTTIISGDVATFTPTTVNEGTSPVYTWNINNTASGNGSTFSTTALQDGDIVSCTLASSALCARPASLISNPVTMTVKPFVDHPRVLSTSPASNALNIANKQNITITFSKAMFLNANIDTLIRISGSYSGKIKGTYSGIGTNTIVFTPSQYTLPGEKVSIAIDSAASDVLGISMKYGYVSEFTVAAAVAPGTLTRGTDIGISRPITVISADLNNDGLVDIISLATGGIQTKLNQSNGVFSSSINLDASNYYNDGMNATDFNNDGFVDICASPQNINNITIYTNDKQGNFSKQNFTTPLSGDHISTGDFNGDGKVDIVLQNNYSSEIKSIVILWNKNNGNFGLSSTILNVAGNSYKTGDFDNDGDLDILVCNGNFTLLKNDGKGNFTNLIIPVLQKLYQTPEIIALGDFDKNGYLDPIVKYQTTFGIIKNMGNGTFSSFDSIGNYAVSAIHYNPAADFDGDGNLDLAFSNFSIGNIDTVDIWRNSGTGTFARYSRKTMENVYQITSLSAADFDNDGDMDIATANLESSTISILLNDGTKPSIANLIFTEDTLCASSQINVIGSSSGTFAADNLFKLQLSDKNGNFSTPTDLGLPQKKLSTLITAPLPASLEAGNGYRMRIVSTDPYIEGKDNGFNITINTGCFTLTAISPENHAQHINLTENIKATFSNNVSTTSPNLSIYGSLSGSYSANKGSFTTTGNAITFSPHSNFFAGEKIYVAVDTSIKSTDGNKLTQPYLSTFTAKAQIAPALFTHYENVTNVLDKGIIAVGDLDKDHDIDFILTDVITDSLSFYLNTGDGTYTFSYSMYVSNEGLAELGDFDRDGDLDLTIIDANKNIQIFQNDGHANFTQKQTIVTGSAMTKNCDINADGYLDIVSLYGGYNKFDFFLNDGKGNLKFHHSENIVDLTWSFLIDDMDNDGDIDIIYGTNNHLVILYNYNNANSFLKTVISSGNWEVGIALCDINSDSFIDIIGTSSMLFNDVNHTFSTSKTMTWDFQAFVVGVADFNGDTKSDLLVSDGLSSRIFLNNGTSDFVERTKLWNTYNAFPGDVDNDGDIDIIGFDNLDRKIGSLLNELSLKKVVVSEQTFCSISKIEIAFQNRGVPQGTTLSAQLSDASGSFNTFQVIGTGKISPIICNVPSTVPVGNGYRIRIVCDSLSLVSADNGVNLTITTSCPVVQSVSPSPNNNSVEPNAAIQATFTTDLLASSINTNAIRIYGNKTGYKSMQQGLSLSNPSTIQYQTPTSFSAGEKVSVYLTHEIKNTDGVPLIAPYVYEFNVKPAPSSGNLILEENTFTAKTPGRSNIFKSGDLNNDGKIDLLIADLSTNTISILLNGQTNTIQFVSSVFYIGDVNIVDMDIDGDLDILIIDTYSLTPLYIYKNDGQANFTLTEKSNAAGSAGKIWSADFNGDGSIDIITSKLNNLSVSINNGLGVFTEKYVIQTVDMNIYPSPKNLFITSIVPVDLDSDGDIDLIGTANTSNSLYFIITFLNDGQGKFTLQDNKISIAEAVNNNIINVADFNNDGKLDIIFQTEYSTKNLNIGINTNGAFVVSTLTLNDYFNSIEIADIDGDSDIDLVTSGSDSRSITTYKNNGTGSFTLFQTVPFDVYILDIEAIDIDTDGDLDFALTTNSDLLLLFNAEPSIITQPITSTSICGGEAFTVPFKSYGIPSGTHFKAELSDATGAFTNNNPVSIGTDTVSPINVKIPPSIAAGNAYRIRVVSEDLTIVGNDNGTNINLTQGCLFLSDVTPNANSATVASLNSVEANFTTDLLPASVNTQSLRIYGSYSGFDSNKGTISLSAPSAIAFNSTHTFFPNEKISVSLTTQIENTNSFHLTKPFVYEFSVKPAASTGAFFVRPSTRKTSDNFNLTGHTGRISKTADLDNDGDLDIVTTDFYTDQLSVYLNNKQQFASPIELSCGSVPQSLTIADIDADGDMDILTTNTGITVFKNYGSAVFAPAESIPLSDNPEGLATADFDGDGNLDIASFTFATGLSVNINNGTGSFTEKTVAFLTDGHAFDLKALDMDMDGDMDIVGTTFSPFHILTFENDGQANFSLSNTIGTFDGAIEIQTADFNNDGQMDFITFEGYNGGGFDIGFNQSTGFRMQHIDFPYNAYSLDVADVDGDGDIDIISSDGGAFTTAVNVLKNDGLGNFTLAQSISLNVSVTSITPNDIDNDGDVDIVTNATDQLGLVILYNGEAPVEVENPTTTGITNASPSTIRIYPNPAQDYINIDSPDLLKEITLYNVLGNAILTTEQTNKINVSELSVGMYTIKVVTDKGTTIQKICIE